MKTLVFVDNVAEPHLAKSYECEDLLAQIKELLPDWPKTARIYHNNLALSADVTPDSEEAVEALGKLEGKFYILVYPQDPITAAILVIGILVGVASVLLLPKIDVPNSLGRTIQSSSPNNALSDRTNQARPKGRIPDVYGQVRSTPDLIALPYKVFRNNVEFEVAYMCVGRGEYAISDIRDDTTNINQIVGSSVEVYGPDTSPNSGVPQIVIGEDIDFPLVAAKRSNSVNGQTLNSFNNKSVNGQLTFETTNKVNLASTSPIKFTDIFTALDNVQILTDIIFVPTGTITNTVQNAYLTADGKINFSTFNPTSFFNVGDVIYVVTNGFAFSGPPIDGPPIGGDDDNYNVFYVTGYYKVSAKNSTSITVTETDGTSPDWSWITSYFGTQTGAQSFDIDNLGTPTEIDLNGIYPIASVSDFQLVLSNPQTINADWNLLAGIPGGITPYQYGRTFIAADKLIGPFILNVPTLTKIYCNFVALNGLYRDDGTNQIALSVEIKIEVTPVDAAGVDIGATETFYATLTGSSENKDSVAITFEIDPSFNGRCKILATRVTAEITDEGQVVDEVKWRDLYAVSPVDQAHFGNVTTVYSVTEATEGALAVKDRKLNLLATRKLPARVAGSTFGALTATKQADDIIAAICLDPYIGNRPNSQIDFDSIYDTIEEVRGYFDTSLASEFSYTFDSNNISFEETVKTIADAVFSVAYRRGSQIKLSFEKQTEISTLLFNHRNKVPNSEVRTVLFGYANNNDGLEFSYVSPVDDAIVTLYLPDDTALNPARIESVGIREPLQAYFQAWRAWNKIKYQNTNVEFEGLQETALLVRNDKILVADNTRSDTIDGEIINQDGLVIELSQEADLSDGPYTIFITHIDASVESMGVTQGSALDLVVLQHAPLMPLALDNDLYARAQYVIVKNSAARPTAFLVDERIPQDLFTSKVTALNYDDRYYSKDKDYANGVIDESGNQL